MHRRCWHPSPAPRRAPSQPPGLQLPAPRFQSPVDILYLLIPLSVVLVFLIGVVFWWSLRSGQFDDLQGPAHRVLDDDDPPLGR